MSGIIIGGLIGWLLPASAVWLAPVGSIFMNMMFVIIVPMIFFSVSSAVCRLSGESALGRTLARLLGIIIVFLLLLSLLTYVAVMLFPPLNAGFETAADGTAVESRDLGVMIVDALTVSDFTELFSIRHILPMMLVAILAGIAAAQLKNSRIPALLDLGSRWTSEMINCLMIVAPVGLGCYFAGMMAENTAMLLTGYGRILGLYLLLTAIIYFVVNPIVARLRGVGIRDWYRAVTEPSLLAVSTLSSSACIPANICAVKSLGCSDAIAETTVPLGTQLFKQGSVIGCVMKVAFAMMLTGGTLTTAPAAVAVVGIALVASVIVGAVPTGAGSAELFICSVLGADPEVLGLLLVFSTLIDIPGTLLNVNGNTLLPLLVERPLRDNNESKVESRKTASLKA